MPRSPISTHPSPRRGGGRGPAGRADRDVRRRRSRSTPSGLPRRREGRPRNGSPSRAGATASGSAARSPCNLPAPTARSTASSWPGRAGSRSPTTRSIPSATRAKTARCAASGDTAVSGRHRRLEDEPLDLLRRALCAPPPPTSTGRRPPDDRPLRRGRQLAGQPGPPLAIAARGPGHREPVLRRRREPGRRGRQGDLRRGQLHRRPSEKCSPWPPAGRRS